MKPVNDIPGCAVKEMKEEKKEEEDERERERSAYNRTTEEEENEGFSTRHLYCEECKELKGGEGKRTAKSKAVKEIYELHLAWNS